MICHLASFSSLPFLTWLSNCIEEVIIEFHIITVHFQYRLLIVSTLMIPWAWTTIPTIMSWSMIRHLSSSSLLSLSLSQSSEHMNNPRQRALYLSLLLAPIIESLGNNPSISLSLIVQLRISLKEIASHLSWADLLLSWLSSISPLLSKLTKISIL